nr:pilin [Dyella telluris]
MTKSQFSESQTIADGLKTPIVEYFNQTGSCPTNSTTGFLPVGSYSGKYVAQAEVAASGASSCGITVTFKAAGSVSKPLGAETVTVTGDLSNGGAVTWSCASAGIPQKYLPQVCAGTK